ncbi:carotenoid oxygenase family protein [Sphingobium lignivorans]|uniref:Dioxygenase n=1 Tax=Sphingobium lignivorans TaxID=2735886 RepID=A0ABR6NCG2_9SPHN|nr:carotenoid oxygenase family protein [Sphingobium lignivorans]MBB5984944.1 carotenoid cleavage dioxygenase [Sphingobium lignivorans]
MVEPIHFPDIELYRGWGEPMRANIEMRGLELISGAIPDGLEGALYRCGADRQYPSGRTDDIFIDGEGQVHMLRFKDNQVDYVVKWVETERYKRQKEARRGLFGGYRNRYTVDESVKDVHLGTANTTAMFHAGHLYALKEDDLPYEIDPETLETIARVDFDGQVTAESLTAHPKVDPITNELLTFSYQAKGDATTDFCFYVFGPNREKVTEIWFNMPYAACVHDFAITKDWVVVPFFPLITDLDVVKQGGPFYQWHPDQPVHVALVPRYGKAEDIRWFKGPTGSAGHMMNAYQDGTKIHLDLCYYEGNCFPFFTTPTGERTKFVPPFLTRMTFDLASNEDGFTTQRLLNIPCEMPRTDDRYQGRPYRYGFAIARGKDASGIARVDHQTGAVDVWNPGEGDGVQEPQFVPRSPDAPEGDGWLLVLVSRVSKNRSDLAILDAQNLAAGPVALLKLPVRVRSTFHGTWVPEETLQSGQYRMSLSSAA